MVRSSLKDLNPIPSPQRASDLEIIWGPTLRELARTRQDTQDQVLYVLFQIHEQRLSIEEFVKQIIPELVRDNQKTYETAFFDLARQGFIEADADGCYGLTLVGFNSQVGLYETLPRLDQTQHRR